VDRLVTCATVVFGGVTCASALFLSFGLLVGVMLAGGLAWIVLISGLNVAARMVVPVWVGSADDWAALLASYIIMLNAYRLLRPAVLELTDSIPGTDLSEYVRHVALSVSGVRHRWKLYIVAFSDHWIGHQTSLFSEHCVAAGRFFGNVLYDIPVLNDLVIFDSENIRDCLASILLVQFGIQVKDDEIALRNDI